MNKRQKEILQNTLTAEEKELKHLKAIYNKALSDINDHIARLKGREDADLQHVIYQIDYQRALKGQVSAILDELNSKQFESISQYMAECYTDGFVGTMYDIAGQGIPIITPIDQKQVLKAMKTDSNISGSLYSKLGEDVTVLKKRIANNLSRGFATGQSYAEMARNIAQDSNVGFNKAARIARTEGARVYNTAAYDAAVKTKEKGADVVKQWDSSLDGNTRPSHRRVDGEIRELDEKFSNGLMYPSDPSGAASEVINCRCTLLQRAKWGLDEDELQTLKVRAAAHGLDKTEQLEDFKKKYLKAAEVVDTFAKAATANILGKTIASNEEIVYNTSPEEKSKLAYEEAIQSGELTPLASLELYQAISQAIDDLLIGTTTENGMKVKSKSDHFIARVIGSVEQRRSGVPIADILTALTHPDRIDPIKTVGKMKSQRFIKKGVCAVTINPETGNLIQTNPMR